MDLRKLKTLIDLVSESGISELEVTEGEGKVRIVKNAPPVYVQPSASYAPQYAQPAPLPGGEAVHLNLYAFANSNRPLEHETEVVVDKFEYLP